MINNKINLSEESNVIIKNLKQMELSFDRITQIRKKDGVFVFRVNCGEKSYVIKYFEKAEYRREIDIYQMLAGLGIQTIPLIAHTNEAILLEDITSCENYRLATEADMSDEKICTALARWYKQLHATGREYVLLHGDKMYCETDCITAKNIAFIKAKTNTENYPVWSFVESNLTQLKKMIADTEKTLTYNDFYYTNLVVAKNSTKAFMFDYNLLGCGYVTSDIINVTCQLSKAAKEAFLREYGEFSADEKSLHEVTGTLITLYGASCREVFPEWGYNDLEDVKNGKLLKSAEKLLGGSK